MKVDYPCQNLLISATNIKNFFSEVFFSTICAKVATDHIQKISAKFTESSHIGLSMENSFS